MLKFYCDVCRKGLDECQCEDLAERFKERFAGSCLEKEAMTAVEAVRGAKTAPEAKRRGRRKVA
jgi:hypothetical protein